ncbi:MAG: hypothetical protein ACOC0J_02620, partial [Myxococcota bacterium]
HKARHYQELRGMPEPVFLAESFHDIPELNRVFDVLTEGYHHDICHGTRDASYIEEKLFENRTDYLKDLSYVLLTLETHDEGRLLAPETGFDIHRGLTFYAIAAASRGALMLQVGRSGASRGIWASAGPTTLGDASRRRPTGIPGATISPMPIEQSTALVPRPPTWRCGAGTTTSLARTEAR